MLEPATGYAGSGRVFVFSAYFALTDPYINYLDNKSLWENIVQWALDTPCPGDFDDSGSRDLSDFTVFAQAYGSALGDGNYNPACDLDDSGSIDLSDFTQFASAFGAVCP